MTGRQTDRLVAEIPSHLKERVDVDEKANKEVVIEALEVYYGVADGDGLQALRHRLEQEQERKERLKREKERKEEKLTEADENIERLQSQLEQFTENIDDYQEELADLIAQANESERMNIIPDLKIVKDIADRHDKTPETVVDDAKAESDLPESRFQRGQGRVER